MAKKNHPRIVIPIYDDFNMLDMTGPYVMFQNAGLQPTLVAHSMKTVISDEGVGFVPQATFDDYQHPEVFFVPGGFGKGYFKQFKKDGGLIQWLRHVGKNASLICSVCTGAHLLGAAELLDGYTATTHWYFKQSLTLFPGVQLADGFPRYWIDRNRVTGGGISSGLDESLAVIAILKDEATAMTTQLFAQYAPDPPYRSGSPEQASPKTLSDFYQGAEASPGELETVIEDFLRSAGQGSF